MRITRVQFLLKGAIQLGQGWFWAVPDLIVEVGDEPLRARLIGQHEAGVGEQVEVDIPVIFSLAYNIFYHGVTP